MKTFFVIIALGFLMLVPQANAQPAVKLVEYRFEVLPSGTGTSSPYYTHPFALVSASAVLNGPGLLPAMPAYQQGMSGGAIDKAQWTDHWSIPFDPSDYYGITLNPPAGQTLVIDQVRCKGRISTTGPQSKQLRTSVDAFASTQWSTTSSSTGWQSYVIPLAGVQNLGPITIRIYGYGSTGTLQAGTFRIDTLQVFGHLQDVFNLPIELLSFTGQKLDEDKARLDWVTASEQGNDYFTVYRSPDTQNWDAIGEVDGAGNSTSTLHYSLVDENPLPGINYYHLRQTDFDGAFTTSPVVAMNFGDTFELIYGPNSTVSWGDEQTTLLDAVGREIESARVQHFLSTSGMYFLRTQDERSVRLMITP